MTSPPPPSAITGSARLLWWILLAASLGATGFFLFAVAQRLPYPHELEWMEGALVDHAMRVANGQPLYCAPGPEHVALVYTPLLPWLGALGIGLGLDGLFVLRLVAVLGTIGSALLIGHWVRREGGDRMPGLVASGLFLAGYGWLAWWYDLARNDALLVFTCLMTAYVLRHGGRSRWWQAALLACAAFLTKQTALLWLAAIATGALCHDWRVGLRFLAAAATAIVASIGLLHLQSDGWSSFFLFELPGHHVWPPGRLHVFWVDETVPMLPLTTLALAGFVAQWRTGARGGALFLAAVGSGGMVASWTSCLHAGSFANSLMYGFASACVLGPIAAARSRRLRVPAARLLLVQFGSLANAACARGTLSLLPSTEHRRAHEELLEFVKAQHGPVWIPAHGGILRAIGAGTGAHGQAILDLVPLLPRQPDGLFDLSALTDRSKLGHLSPRGQEAIAGLGNGMAEALRQRRFAAIVIDEPAAGFVHGVFAAGWVGADGQLLTEDDTYVRRPGQLLTTPAAIRPLIGCLMHSPIVFVPRQ